MEDLIRKLVFGNFFVFHIIAWDVCPFNTRDGGPFDKKGDGII